jgi:tRNA(adenine34) deaminase
LYLERVLHNAGNTERSHDMDNRDKEFMAEALKEALNAFEEGEVPVGAVLVRDGKIVARARNQREKSMDPTAHAEVLALRAGVSDGWRLSEATLYVTKEPCVMCAGAILNSRLKRVVFGCRDRKGGAVESLYRLLDDPRLNHRVEVVSGVMKEESALVLQDFFRQRRGGRVVECGGLENRCGGDSTGGSNPPLSARNKDSI